MADCSPCADNAGHIEAQSEHGIGDIDLLVVNLYPFEATVPRRAYDECIENIDIGGPAMIRAAAKNHAVVTVVVDAPDYRAVLADMAANDGATTLATRDSSPPRPMPAPPPMTPPSAAGSQTSSN